MLLSLSPCCLYFFMVYVMPIPVINSCLSATPGASLRCLCFNRSRRRGVFGLANQLSTDDAIQKKGGSHSVHGELSLNFQLKRHLGILTMVLLGPHPSTNQEAKV